MTMDPVTPPRLHVVHLSSAHASSDPRIRLKELASVVSIGWRATFVTGDLDASGGDGVEILRVWPGNRSRLARLLLTSWLCVFRALRVKANVYHIHDPELLLSAWLLRLRAPVVYDIHEDYVTSIEQKTWLPRLARGPLAALCGRAEALASVPCARVIAERYYASRFPGALPILNYPTSALYRSGAGFDANSRHLLYTGNVSLDRGAEHMARMLLAHGDVELTMVGRCSPAVAAAVRRVAGGRADDLTLVGEARYVPFEEIVGHYRHGGWLAGLALFPDTPHYREKELTKFFEYMAFGLPIIASDFPAWRRLIADQGVGLCVDPEDMDAVADAIETLRNEPARAQAMSERGRELAATRYNWESEGRRLTEFYEQLVGYCSG